MGTLAGKSYWVMCAKNVSMMSINRKCIGVPSQSEEKISQYIYLCASFFLSIRSSLITARVAHLCTVSCTANCTVSCTANDCCTVMIVQLYISVQP